jgi:hypothetical protein
MGGNGDDGSRLILIEIAVAHNALTGQQNISSRVPYCILCSAKNLTPGNIQRRYSRNSDNVMLVKVKLSL